MRYPDGLTAEQMAYQVGHAVHTLSVMLSVAAGQLGLGTLPVADPPAPEPSSVLPLPSSQRVQDLLASRSWTYQVTPAGDVVLPWGQDVFHLMVRGGRGSSLVVVGDLGLDLPVSGLAALRDLLEAGHRSHPMPACFWNQQGQAVRVGAAYGVDWGAGVTQAQLAAQVDGAITAMTEVFGQLRTQLAR